MQNVLSGELPDGTKFDAQLPGFGIDLAQNSLRKKISWISTPQHHNVVTDQVTETIAIPHMEWARAFDDDPQARKMSDGGKTVTNVADQINKLREAGWDIEVVEVQGGASDEDNSLTNAGLGVPNQKNVDLANVRGETTKEMLEKALGGTDVEVKLLPGVEVEDPELNEEIFSLAKQRGMTTLDFVQNFNRGNTSSYSPKEMATLQKLAEQRGSTITFDATKSETIEFNTYRKGEAREVADKTNVGLATIITAPILTFRRQRRPTTLPEMVPGMAPPEKESSQPKHRQIPPREIGKARKGYSAIHGHHKQPGKLNNGGNHGSRGQRDRGKY